MGRVRWEEEKWGMGRREERGRTVVVVYLGAEDRQKGVHFSVVAWTVAIGDRDFLTWHCVEDWNGEGSLWEEMGDWYACVCNRCI